MNKLKYLIYCRKSSESRDKQALSIEAQIRELQEFAVRNELEVVDIFEESQSAFKLGRPVFNALMERIESGQADGLLVWKLDRLARNPVDGGRIIHDLDGRLKEIRTTFESFKSEDNRLMLYMYFGMSNDYSRQISANVKRGNRQKYFRGEYLGKAPLGYLNFSDKSSHNIVIDPEKGPIVRRLFEEYGTGLHAVSDVAKIAESLGLRSVFGNPLHKSALYALLRRSTYYGYYRHGGEVHKGTFEPLISKALFDQVQKVLSNRNKPKQAKWVHEYKGILMCATCGCSITAETKKKYYKTTNRHAAYTYYRCTRRRGHCGEPEVTEKELVDMLKAVVNDVVIDQQVWELGLELVKAKHFEQMEEMVGVKRRLDNDLATIEKSLGKALEMRMNEEITLDEYQAVKRSLFDRKASLESKLVDRSQTSNTWLELAEKFFETAFHARQVMEEGSPEEKRQLLKEIGENLVLKDGKVVYTVRKPYDVLLKPRVRDDVQGRIESNYHRGFWRLASYH